jgi:Zn-dependent protease/CBS domain-containing protein
MPRSGLKIGQLFGINIRVDWSWLLIFLLVTWNLGAAFNDIHGDWSVALVLGTAVVAALLFFTSVMVHEFAHSLVAKARGVNVKSITLFLFGGVSNIERDPDSPTSEFLITIVGPLTSFVLGIALLILSTFVTGGLGDATTASAAIEDVGPVGTLLIWLGSINILLAVFNMIPGFPLDGGRILRSLLWGATGNLRQATRWAATVGQFVAWTFIFIGISMVFGVQVPLFGSGVIGGLWLAFIGWFLNNASAQSQQRVIVQDILEDVPVTQLMYAEPITVSSNTSISDLVHSHIMKSDDHAFPVVDNGQFVGLVTLEDVRSVPREEWDTKQVSEIMSPASELVVTEPDEDADEAWTKLSRRDVRQLPVLRDGNVVGLLRRRDIVKWLQFQSELSTG